MTCDTRMAAVYHRARAAVTQGDVDEALALLEDAVDARTGDAWLDLRISRLRARLVCWVEPERTAEGRDAVLAAHEAGLRLLAEHGDDADVWALAETVHDLSGVGAHDRALPLAARLVGLASQPVDRAVLESGFARAIECRAQDDELGEDTDAAVACYRDGLATAVAAQTTLEMAGAEDVAAVAGKRALRIELGLARLGVVEHCGPLDHGRALARASVGDAGMHPDELADRIALLGLVHAARAATHEEADLREASTRRAAYFLSSVWPRVLQRYVDPVHALIQAEALGALGDRDGATATLVAARDRLRLQRGPDAVAVARLDDALASG